MPGKISTAERILACASQILERDGPNGVTTRAVCKAAKITAPTLYHHFGDKDGLLNELVVRGFRDFAESKRETRESDDALLDLRRGWDRFLEFSLSKPWLFRLMIENIAENAVLVGEAHAITRSRLIKLHAQGRLATNVDFALRIIVAASNGVTALFTQGAPRKDIEEAGAFLFEAIVRQLVRGDSSSSQSRTGSQMSAP
jgi:AcrR family transcriptional regulator